MRSYLSGKTMDEVAMDRLREFEAEALRMHPNGYWLAFSGGKDSVVILDLAERAGVKFEAVHNLTTVDPPELVRFVKTFPNVRINKPEMSMWKLIRKRGLPPRRAVRYCCEVLKERGGDGRMVVTGIRWGESNRRSKRGMVEACYRSKKRMYLHPIIDWPTAAVWEYIRERELPYCSLYDEGFSRVGCILCPMTRDVAQQMERWPTYARSYEKAIKATFKPDETKRTTFKTAEEYWQWWLDRDAPGLVTDDDPVLFEDDPGLATEALEQDEEGYGS